MNHPFAKDESPSYFFFVLVLLALYSLDWLPTHVRPPVPNVFLVILSLTTVALIFTRSIEINQVVGLYIGVLPRSFLRSFWSRETEQ